MNFVEHTSYFRETFKSGIPVKLLHALCEKRLMKPYMKDIFDHDEYFLSSCLFNEQHDVVMKSLIDCKFYDLLNKVSALVKLRYSQ